MPVPRIFTSGSYSYLPSVFQYSAGVMAEPGYRLEQIRFKHAIPLQDGFKAVESRLRFLGRPFTAFAHCELRSPKQFDDQGFIDFNKTNRFKYNPYDDSKFNQDYVDLYLGIEPEAGCYKSFFIDNDVEFNYSLY